MRQPNDETPYEMAQISMARSLKQDHSYNFQGEMRAYLSKPQEGVAPETVSANRQAQALADEASAADEAIAAAKRTPQRQPMPQRQVMLRRLKPSRKPPPPLPPHKTKPPPCRLLLMLMPAIWAAKWQITCKNIRRWRIIIANGRLKVDGALDLRAEKMELTSELVLQGRNEYTSIKVPMLFNGKDMSVTVDTPALVPVVWAFSPTCRCASA